MRRPLTWILLLALALPASALAREYQPRRAGHPLRIVAYALHPVGFILDRLIFYPAWRIGQWEPIAPLVGMERTVRDFELENTASKARYPNVLIEIGPAKSAPEEPSQP